MPYLRLRPSGPLVGEGGPPPTAFRSTRNRPQGTSTSSRAEPMSPLSLNRHLTWSNTVRPSMLGPARTPSLTGTDLLCPAFAYGPPVHSENASRIQYKLRAHVPIVPQPAPDSDEHGPALDARTGPHSLPDWDGPTVPGLRLRPSGPPGHRPQGTSTSPELMSPSTLNRHLTRTNMASPLAARTGPHSLPDWDGPTVPSLNTRLTGPLG